MNKIYIARHGQDEDNAKGILNGHRNTPLTQIGFNQANELVGKIQQAGIVFDKIYCSPLDRAHSTAEVISEAFNLNEPEINYSLIERDFGIMTGRRADNIMALCSPDIIETRTITYFLCPKGAETFPQLIIRAEKFLHFIEQRHDNQSILLVTHGDFGKMLYTAFYQLEWIEVLTAFHFGNSELLLLSADISPSNAHIFNIKQYNN